MILLDWADNALAWFGTVPGVVFQARFWDGDLLGVILHIIMMKANHSAMCVWVSYLNLCLSNDSRPLCRERDVF